ncbi:MAG: ABC transporter substrate-binding protein [Micavibrio aeruginosavorus]|nr:ABC transporter substrate-binding protein [Micavibrio aeruginosavorus]
MPFLPVRTLLLTSALSVSLVAAGHARTFPVPETAGAASPLILSTTTSTQASSQIQEGAENFISSMARRALDFLGNAQQTQAQKSESFRRLLEDNYDMETIGRFTMGRYWKTATPAQRTEYQRLFKKRVVEMYSNRFSEYKGQKFETRGARAEGENDTIVSSMIIPVDGTPEVSVDWRVRYKDGRYRVVDVIVAGVSMSVTQRSDFASVIQQGGGDVQVLIDHLKQKI